MVDLDLEVFQAGTIDDIFHARRGMPQRSKAVFDPLGLPKDKFQCVHIEEHHEELSEGYQVNRIRCLNNAEKADNRHGWLCDHHYDAMVPFRPYKPVQPVHPVIKDRDLEIVEAILALERRKIAQATRHVVTVGAKIRISFAV